MPDLPERYARFHRFRFGDGPQLCAELLELVLAGKKTGTCWPLRDQDIEPMVAPGECAIYTNWDGSPRCIVEYTRVEICRFDEVTEEFALSEGENDSLEGWRRDHRVYFERNGGWSADMELVCENFRVIEVFD